MLRGAALVPCCVLFAAFAVTACGGEEDGPTDLPPLGKDGTALRADEYQTTKFRPQTSFKVGKDWETASAEVPDYFDLVRANAFEAIAFQRVTSVADPRAPSSPVPAPRNLVSWIRKHPRLVADLPKKTTIGGQPATQVDVRVKSAAPRKQRPTSCDRPCLPLFHPSDGRPVSYEPGDKLRFLIVKAGGRQVTITIAAEAANFDRFVPQAEKVLSTVKFAKD